MKLKVILPILLVSACSSEDAHNEPTDKHEITHASKKYDGIPKTRFEEAANIWGIYQVFKPKRVELPMDASVKDPQVAREINTNTHLNMTGGLAVGDVNGDELPDVFLLGSSKGNDALYINNGKGFDDATGESGIDHNGGLTNGASFADITGDGLDDLIVGGAVWHHELKRKSGKQEPAFFSIWKNKGANSFEDITESTGLSQTRNIFSTAFGDYDADGDLDMAVGHWHRIFSTASEEAHLWNNQGDGTFVNAAKDTGLLGSWSGADWSFTPIFADINDDFAPDLLMVADFESSQYFINQGGKYVNKTDLSVITDENGMGSSVGDFDNDGDQDWFVSSVFDPSPEDESVKITSWGTTGNRLYLNQGNGDFTDATEGSGVRDGGWGWASCAADFNNDGWLDIFHVNGYLYDDHPAWLFYAKKFSGALPRLFINQQDGTFVDKAKEWGFSAGEGRAISCTDFDRDGDVDILIQQSAKPTLLYENKLEGIPWIGVKLKGFPGNPHAAGAKVTVKTASGTQMREIRIGSNYLSQDAAEAFFGLGNEETIELLCVYWPRSNGGKNCFDNVHHNQWLHLTHPKLGEDSGAPK